MSNFDIFDRAIANGNAYRVSMRHTMADGEELIIHFDPASSGQTLYIVTPAIEPPEIALIDVYENAAPGASTNDDLQIHNMRYDVAAEDETPDATITRVTNGGLDTSSADKTEETQLRGNGEYQTPGDTERRALWRIISGSETVSMVITDDSGGAGNRYGYDTAIYENVRWD